MPRIPYPNPTTLTTLQRRSFDSGLNVGRIVAHMPDDVLAGFSAVGRAVLSNTVLDPILREMVIVRVGYLSEAPYEIHQHNQLARALGMDEAKRAALERGAADPIFSAKEASLLQFVDELVRNVRPSDDALETLRRHFSIPEIFTIIVSAGTYMMVSRLLETSGIELDEEGQFVNPASL